MSDVEDSPAAQAEQRALRLLEVLDLQKIEENLFLGHNEVNRTARLFGGQVLAQAAQAAYNTVDDLQLHSLHGYFLRAGDVARPVLFEIERIRDGRSFTTRRVVGIQSGQAIFSMDVSFQIDEPGFEHAEPMPNVPLPDELEDDIICAERLGDDPRLGPMAKIARPFEMRSVFAIGSEAWTQERYFAPTWIRFRAPVDVTDTVRSRCLLAYASDMSLVSTAGLPHGQSRNFGGLQMASLDHALWIHRPVPIDQWLLFHKRTSTAQSSRGMVHADFYTQEGGLVASVTQEGLLRPLA
ncbi:MAG: acyl-CoA thioesterase domain-containing protein [Pseudomonadota bacterium]